MGTTDRQKREQDASTIDRAFDSLRGAAYRLFDQLRRSFFLSLTFLGVLLFVVGLIRGDGVVAGMLGILSATAIAIGLGIYAALRFLRDY